MQIKMSILLVVEAYLFSPSDPHGCALKLHTALQQFAWVEAAAPALQRRRGLPDEPLFCFETMLKSCYFALHSYRHFRVRRGWEGQFWLSWSGALGTAAWLCGLLRMEPLPCALSVPVLPLTC